MNGGYEPIKLLINVLLIYLCDTYEGHIISQL